MAFRDVAEAEQAQRLAAQFGAQRVGPPGPEGPLAAPQVGVGPCQRHVALQQRREHVLGDRILVAVAVAQRGPRRQQRQVDRVGAGGGRLVQLRPPRRRQRRVELDTDDNVGRREVLGLSRGRQRIADVDDRVAGLEQLLEAVAEVGGIRAVEDDLQCGHGRCRLPSRQPRLRPGGDVGRRRGTWRLRVSFEVDAEAGLVVGIDIALAEFGQAGEHIEQRVARAAAAPGSRGSAARCPTTPARRSCARPGRCGCWPHGQRRHVARAVPGRAHAVLLGKQLQLARRRDAADLAQVDADEVDQPLG